LELAQVACEATENCYGLTEVAGESYFFYELRQGPEIVKSDTNSWVMSCDDSNENFTFADPKDLEEDYPELEKKRVKNSNNECVYFGKFETLKLDFDLQFLGKYAHINKLLEFNPNLNPAALVSPPACSDENLIFGIKKDKQKISQFFIEKSVLSSQSRIRRTSKIDEFCVKRGSIRKFGAGSASRSKSCSLLRRRRKK
jgi:hypothetical protein